MDLGNPLHRRHYRRRPRLRLGVPVTRDSLPCAVMVFLAIPNRELPQTRRGQQDCYQSVAGALMRCGNTEIKLVGAMMSDHLYRGTDPENF